MLLIRKDLFISVLSQQFYILRQSFLCSCSAFLLFLGFLELKTVRENKERRRPVKEEYGLIFDGSPTQTLMSLSDLKQEI